MFSVDFFMASTLSLRYGLAGFFFLFDFLVSSSLVTRPLSSIGNVLADGLVTGEDARSGSSREGLVSWARSSTDPLFNVLDLDLDFPEGFSDFLILLVRSDLHTVLLDSGFPDKVPCSAISTSPFARDCLMEMLLISVVLLDFFDTLCPIVSLVSVSAHICKLRKPMNTCILFGVRASVNGVCLSTVYS